MSFSVRATLEQFALPHPSGPGMLTISVAPPVGVGTAVLYVVDGDLLFGMSSASAMTPLMPTS